jgi:thiamine-monophosphate kinase
LSGNLEKILKYLGNTRINVSSSSEDDILKLVEKKFPSNLLKSDYLTIPAFADDACVLDPNLIGAGNELVITSDALVEGADFLFDWMPLYDLGYKSIAVNLSDIASMGAEPLGMIAVVGISENFLMSDLESFIDGLSECAKKYNVLLLGGDLSSSEKFFVNITLLGRIPKNTALRRSGIIEGDAIAVTGFPGEARAGLEIISGKAGNVRSEERIFVSRFLRPEPRLDVGYILRESGIVHGCIDLSDGLAKDLSRIAKINGLKANIYADKLPATELLKNFWKTRNKNEIENICIGGEDFELLFSIDPKNFDSIKQKIESSTGVAITKIGEWIRGDGVSLIMPDSRTIDISGLGFDHFSKGTNHGTWR